MKNKTQKVTSTIPFQGYYGSDIDSFIDSHIEYEIENIKEEYKPDEKQLETIANGFMSTNVNSFYNNLSKEYAEEFIFLLENEIGFKLNASFESLESPKEYNFSTDRIFIELSESKAIEFVNYILKNHKEELEDLIKKRFTSQSGFISFYPNSLEAWGNPIDWDYNQLGTCFEIFEYIGNDIKLNESIYNGIYETLDSESNYILDELIEKKKIAEYNDSIQIKLQFA
jgi:hypothetical protein